MSVGSFADVTAPARNRWDTPSDRLLLPLEDEPDSQTWADATRDMQATYKSERINGYSNGFIGRARAKYARMKDGDRHINRHTDEYHVVLLTLGGRFHDENNVRKNPLTFREDLLESRPTVRQRMKDLQDEFGGLGFFSVVSGNGSSAYSHVHIVAFFGDKITTPDLNPIRRAHVDNSPVARDIIPDNYVSIEHSSNLSYDARETGDIARGPTCGATTYVASQAPHIGGLSQSDRQIEHSAVCRASGSSWDTYLSPRFKEHAESERMERELAKVQRMEKMRVRCGVEPDTQSNNNLCFPTDSSSASSLETYPFGSNPTHIGSDSVWFGSKNVPLRINPTLRHLLWLHGYPLRPEICLTTSEI